jgi:hypothetical protein
MYLVLCYYVGNECIKRSYYSFGLMNEKFETIKNFKIINDQLLTALDAKAGEAKGVLSSRRNSS